MTEAVAWVKWRFDKWRNDEGLRMCSLAARGLWADLLAIMHGCTPYGHLLVNGRVPTPKQVASLVGMTSEREVTECLAELRDNGVCSIADNGAIYCRRMVRDNQAREQSKQYGSLGGNPSLTKRVIEGVNPPIGEGVNIEKELEREKEKEPDIGAQRRKRVQADWWPDDNGIAFASERQISPDLEVPRFRDHHIAKGSLMVDWAAAWRTWVQNAVKFRADKPKPTGTNGHDLLAGRWGDDRITEEKGRPVVNGYYVDHVSERLADITGLAVTPSDRIMVQWLADGYEPDEFVPVVRRLAERADGVSTLAYFDRAVREQRPTSKPISQAQEAR